ncbi:flagellar motor switch protein FliG [Occultella glacieicola]|uniref:Flagellar motor switch protein FliG n=1 Tax=Occultella glacieicola TaxID=2518684 RepID=A0ABY2E4J3_9MICO|nr:flagellar motor switch protein FliG [Occultella glacieicola]TDE94733.1 flagellar motor switch protein FliG [Occultella glacieicola]
MSVTDTELTGVQKVALLLMQLEQERAAKVMQRFTEAEAEEITAEIVRLRRVDRSVADAVVTEVHDSTITSRFRSRGGKDVATGLLEASFGSERAAGVMTRVESSMAGQQFEFLDTVEDPHLVQLLEGEHPQTVAIVLAHLRPERASGVLSVLPDHLRPQLARRIATMGPSSPEAVSIVAETLKQRVGAATASREAADNVGGVVPLVEIINRADKRTETAVLEGLDQLDPDLAEEVRAQLLTFADVVHVEDLDMQKVLRGIDPAMLAIALRGATPAISDKITANISSRNREILDEETARPVRLRASQVEDARNEVVLAMRRLEASGELVVVRGSEDRYVD